jgi:hypothetical protein
LSKIGAIATSPGLSETVKKPDGGDVFGLQQEEKPHKRRGGELLGDNK